MADCWASSVSPCEGGMSDEHYFTYGLFLSPTIRVQGLPWLDEGEVKELPLKRLVTQSLCVGHNQALGDLDEAAIDVMNAMRRLHELRRIRKEKPRKHWYPCRFSVDGPRFERWTLKTAINLTYTMRRLDRVADSPLPDCLPAQVFGQEPLPDGAGLGALMKLGDEVSDSDAVGAAFLHHLEEPLIGGLLLGFHGFRFISSWTMPLKDLLPIEIDGRRYEKDDVMAHPRGVYLGPRSMGLSLHFECSDTFQPSKQLRALRKRYPSPPR